MVIIYIWLALVLTIVVGGFYLIYTSISNTFNRDFKYQINLHKEGFRRSQFPIVKVKIRDSYKFFIVDSGANINMMSKSCYKEIVGKGSIKGSKPMQVSGIGSESSDANIMPMVLETIKVGDDSFEEEFGILDSWEHAREQAAKASGLPIVGVLGSPFCKTAKWVIDFEELVIWVKRPNK